MIKFLIFAALAAAIPWEHDHWRHTQLWGCVVFIAMLLFPVSKRYGALPYVALMSAVIQSLDLVYFGDRWFGVYQDRGGVWAGAGVVILVSFAAMSTRLRLIANPNLYRFFYLGLVNSIILLLSKRFRGDYFGMLNASSFDALFIACCYPILAWYPTFTKLHEKKLWRWVEAFACAIIPVVVIFLTKSSSAYIALWLGFVAYAASAKWNMTARTVFIAGLLFAIVWTEGDFLNNSRFLVWNQTYGLFDASPDHWLSGFGLGSFETLMPVYQHRIGQKELFSWAHSDFMQIVFENGIFGVMGVAAMIYRCVMLSWKTPWLFSTVVSCLIAMLSYSPLRYIPFQILILVVVLLCEREGIKHGTNPNRWGLNLTKREEDQADAKPAA